MDITNQETANGQPEGSSNSIAVDGVTRHDQTLFHLETELCELIALREDMENASEDTGAIDGQISEYVRREISKVDNIRAYLRHCDVMQAAATEEVKRLSALAHTWKQRRERLKECCRITMEAFGAKRIEGKTGSISLRGNGGLAPLEIYDESLVPPEMIDMTVTMSVTAWAAVLRLAGLAGVPAEVQRAPNNAKIRESLKAGPVAGARLGERSSHIEVR